MPGNGSPAYFVRGLPGGHARRDEGATLHVPNRRNDGVLSGHGGRSLRTLFGIGDFSRRGALTEVVRLSVRRRPALTAAACIVLLVVGLIPAAGYVIAGRLIDSVSRGTGYVPWVLAAAIAAFLIASVPAVKDAVVSTLAREIELEFRHNLLTATSGRLPVSQLEQPRVRDLVAKSRGLVSEDRSPGATIRGYGYFLPNKLAGLLLVALLASFHWWLGVGVLACALVIRRVTLVLWFRSLEVLHGDVEGIRRADYVRNLALERDTAREIQVFGLSHWIVARHTELWLRSMREVWKRRSVVGLQMVSVAGSVFVVGCLAALVIARGLIDGRIGPGDAIALGGALTALIYLGGLQPEADLPIRYGFESVAAVREIQSIPGPTRTAAPREPAHSAAVSVSDVSFGYVAGQQVIEKVSFDIDRGETVALVGENGAGKTTLVKLIAGLLEPSAGTITVNGSEATGLHEREAAATVSAVFQDFGRYELSLRENVCLGRGGLGPEGEARLGRVASAAGLDSLLGRLPHGWDTVLSADYPDGVDVSGGQWQRIALARALYGLELGSTLLVLDEPTASLDVRAELEFFDELMSVASSVTTILVSHRFSTVRRADRIHVLDNGRIVESGSHTELMRLDGRYAEMYRVQASRYVS
ncbi:ABC transporter ATP-binding protein [Streptomyces sp. B6B3]|uniref:ABC transporter ATP-binding protein n=1 Tax=Streptomyces sp. B6B3 TaxID=3153570 RepID=UPI00325DE8E3